MALHGRLRLCTQAIKSLASSMKKKLRVALLFGGRSVEHEISVQSAKNIFTALDPARYEAVLVGIDFEGRWHTIEAAFLLEASQGTRVPVDRPRLAVVPGGGRRFLIPALDEEAIPMLGDEIDVVFPILHGPHGEDGTVQGLLQLAGVPFVGCGVLGSAAGMDKDVMKRLLRDAGLPVGRFVTLDESSAKNAHFDLIVEQVGAPFFVKPSNLGSSVGIHKVSNPAEWERYRADALRYDHKIIVEEFVDGREIEVAVLGNRPFSVESASLPGEIAPKGEFYDYQSKYLNSDGAKLFAPATLDTKQRDEFRRLAAKTCDILCVSGLSRVDFFLRKSDGAIFVNEINTFPGFTRVSMFPKLWEVSGLSYSALIDRMVELALERHNADSRLDTSLSI